MAGLSIQLLGKLDVRLGEDPLPRLRTRKDLVVLAYLALAAGKPVERSVLVGALWPDSDEKTGLYNLSRSLSELRRALGAYQERIVSPTMRTVCLQMDSEVFVDILAFDTALRRWQKSGELTDAQEALALYRGPLLEGWDELWLDGERAQREQACLDLLDASSEKLLLAEDMEQALPLLRRAERVDPFRESTQRLLYRTLGRAGEQAAALHAFREFRQRLRRELGEEPSAETLQVIAEIRSGAPKPPSASPSPLALPQPVTELHGREGALGTLAPLLREGRTRLLTLTGPGGIGKTRLSIALGKKVAPVYPDSVFFCELAPLPPQSQEESIWEALATALRLPPTLRLKPQEAVSAFLETRQALLILDNAEHVRRQLGAVVSGLRQRAPEVTFLVTSREPLGLPGEFVRLVEPLSTRAAVGLFCERADEMGDIGTLNPVEVAAICSQLAGLPLAIELAAAQMRYTSLPELLERLQAPFTVLKDRNNTHPDRHQTLERTLRESWDLLTPAEQEAFAALSALAGTWTLTAAESIACAPAELVFSLVDRSLITVVRQESGTRFRLLEPIRAYGRERLTERQQAEVIQKRHAEFFAQFVVQIELELSGSKQAELLNRLELERENLNQAVEWGLTTGTPESIALALDIASRLTPLWELHGHFDEGRRFQSRVLSALQESANALRRAELLGGSWTLAICQGDFPAARAFADAEHALRCQLGEPLAIARALHHLGGVELRLGNYEQAQGIFQESLELKRAHEASPQELIQSLLNLEVIANELGETAQAAAYFEECVTYTRQAGPQKLLGMALNNLGLAYEYQGELEQGLACLMESLTIKATLGDRRGTAITLQNAARIRRIRGNYADARTDLMESLRLLVELGDAHFAAVTIHGLGCLEAAEDKPLHAARLWGCWEATAQALKVPLSPKDQQETQAQFQTTRATCPSPQEFDAVWESGRRTEWKALAKELLER